MFEGNIAKLGDLNISKVAKKEMSHTQTGTPYFASPEIWSDQPYDLKSDIWSLGCVLYEMATLRPPFIAQNMKDLYKRIMKGKTILIIGFYRPIPTFYSKELSLMIKQLLELIPSLRPTCSKMILDF